MVKRATANQLQQVNVLDEDCERILRELSYLMPVAAALVDDAVGTGG